MISVDVPGKVMLSGEYAVLYGGTAVLAPVPRFVNISEDENNESQKLSPVAEASLKLPIPELEDFERDNTLNNVTIDNSQFFIHDSEGNRIKLGLGSSAAEAVGIVQLRFERAGFGWPENREMIREYADRAHREAQGGLGSGADIAVCAYRRPIRFSRSRDSVSVKPIQPSETTTPLHLAWTGESANTRELVVRFQEWLSHGGREADDLLSQLVGTSHRVAETWFGSQENEQFRTLDDFCDALQKCMHAARIQHKLPVHDKLEEWAEGRGGLAKPTGAGGGDMILLIGDLPVDELNMEMIPLEFSSI